MVTAVICILLKEGYKPVFDPLRLERIDFMIRCRLIAALIGLLELFLLRSNSELRDLSSDLNFGVLLVRVVFLLARLAILTGRFFSMDILFLPALIRACGVGDLDRCLVDFPTRTLGLEIFLGIALENCLVLLLVTFELREKHWPDLTNGGAKTKVKIRTTKSIIFFVFISVNIIHLLSLTVF
jgi:hypothetical protein